MRHLPHMKEQERAFTLVETLVAITVLLLVIIGPITVAQKGIQAAFYANEQVTAVFLAQEAIEAMRELRDGAALAAYDNAGGGSTWSWNTVANLPSGCGTSSGCGFDVVTQTFEECSAGNDNCELSVNPTTGQYNYEAGGNLSGFERRVYTNTSVPDTMSVRVVVRWNSSIFGGSTVRSVTLETWLYDHYARYEN